MGLGRHLRNIQVALLQYKHSMVERDFRDSERVRAGYISILDISMPLLHFVKERRAEELIANRIDSYRTNREAGSDSPCYSFCMPLR